MRQHLVNVIFEFVWFLTQWLDDICGVAYWSPTRFDSCLMLINGTSWPNAQNPR
jgi:hypothetical protein